MEDDFKEYQKRVVKNAQAMAEVFQKRGFDVISGGTKNHLFLLSLIKAGHHGQGRGRRTGSCQHHGQQERGTQ